MTAAFVIASVLVYATALAAIIYGLTAGLLPGQGRIGFAAMPVAYGQYAIVSTTVLLFRLDGPAFAYPFIASVCLIIIAVVVAVVAA